MYKMVEKILKESSIDFPRLDLSPSVWGKEDDSYFLKPEVKETILNIIDKYPNEDLLQTAREIRIVGSIGTNLFIDDVDIDIHIIPKDFSEWNEKKIDNVMKWFNENRDKIGGYIGTHPIEVYIQTNPNQDLLSDSCYDMLEDKWMVGPRIVPMNYNPYKDYSHIFDRLKDLVKDADILFGELKRDVIDYDTIKKAMEYMDVPNRKKLLKMLQDKLVEIEKDIEKLYSKRKEWVNMRRKASKPHSPEEALKDVELVKTWKDTNALFKYINRYQYLRVIKDLEKLVKDDGKIGPEDVEVIKNIVGVQK